MLSNASVQNLRAQVNQLQQDRTQVTERYGEKHPNYQKVISQLANVEGQLKIEVQKAVQNARTEYESARGAGTRPAAAVEQVKGRGHGSQPQGR